MRRYWLHTVFFLALNVLSLQVISPVPGEPASTPSIILNNIRYWPASDYTRIVLDLSNPTAYTDKYLPDPDRLYINLENTFIVGSIPSVDIENGLVKQVRAAQNDKHTVRVVIDLTGKVNYNIFLLTSPERLVVDIYKDVSDEQVPHSPPQKSNEAKTPTIVIDPGHGGKDPGAIGKKGLKEKDIVLDVGIRLKRLIKDKIGADVVMTRETDIFIPLEERTAIANKKDADLFISIHANSSRREGASGAETYLLGRATNREAMDTAMRENSATEKSLNELQLILTDLLTTAKKDESLRLAHYVQGNLIENLEPDYKINNLGVKQAPFYVLVNARMPSILAEISFISNREEEQRLGKSKYRQEIAEAILDGIIKYIQSTSSLAYPKEAANISAR